MMQPRNAIDPFTLLMDPQAVFSALERSDSLRSLDSRICRPLDTLSASSSNDAVLAFDEALDAEADPDELIRSDAELHCW